MTGRSLAWWAVRLGVPLVFVALLAALLVVPTLLTTTPAASGAPCLPTVGPWLPGGPTDELTGDQLDAGQREIAAAIIAIGQQRGLPARAWQIALQAGMTESRLRNLDHGDRDSVGIFQMRPSTGWGTVEQLRDVAYQVHAFYGGPDHPPGNPGLLDVPGWEQMRPGDVAQAVERSAFPDRYHEWETLAAALVAELGDVVDPSGCGIGQPGDVAPPTAAAGAAIAFALAQIGKPYVWGATGPNSYDCSGLMLRAYEAAGILLPRVSRQQFHAGAHVAVTDAQPGDLLFWAYDPNDVRTIHHVAMYLGGNEIVEAQQSGVPVLRRAIAWTESELVPLATRPGA